MSVNERLQYIVLVFDEWKASMNHGLDGGGGGYLLARKYAKRCPLAHCLKRLTVPPKDFLAESFYTILKVMFKSIFHV